MPGSDLPYLLHVGMVTMEVTGALQHELCGEPDLAVQCALLHDTLEDTAVSYTQLCERFGTAVADGVRALSKDESLPKHERMADSLARIREQPHAVWLVKLADRITNLQAPPSYWNRGKCRRYSDEAQLILRELGPASEYSSARMRSKIAAYQQHIDAAPLEV
jgi:(p)ppGpp synthase/HD superfamily hydrolase